MNGVFVMFSRKKSRGKGVVRELHELMLYVRVREPRDFDDVRRIVEGASCNPEIKELYWTTADGQRWLSEQRSATPDGENIGYV